MTVKVGQTIIVHGIPSNGHSDQPGIVTCVHGHPQEPDVLGYVNAKVFPDCGSVQDCTSILVHTNVEAARAYGKTVFAVPG